MTKKSSRTILMDTRDKYKKKKKYTYFSIVGTISKTMNYLFKIVVVRSEFNR